MESDRREFVIYMSTGSVHFFGCSFTEGAETPDHKFLGISREECDAIKRKTTWGKFYSMLHTTIQKNYNLPELDDAVKMLRDENIKHSWAKYLADLLDMKYYNYAHNGTGLEHLYIQLELNIQYVDPDNDIVFIGLTSKDRYVFIDDTWEIKCKILAFQEQDYKHPYYVFTENTMEWMYWKQLSQIIMMLRSKNIKFYLVPVLSSAKILSNNINDSDCRFPQIPFLIKKFHEQFSSDILNIRELRDEMLHSYPDTHNVWITGFGHVYEEAHELYARKVFDLIKGNLDEFN